MMGQLFQDRIPAGTWENMRAAAARAAGWSADEEVYVYLETVNTCTLTKTRLTQCLAPELPFEGRFFNARADVRWLWREDDGSFEAWVTREATETDPAGSTCEFSSSTPRRYFLFGIDTGTTEAAGRVFKESRFPDKSFVYPVAEATVREDRAFIEVIEYERAKPNWDRFSAEAAIEDVLNQPMLLGHRFVSVGAGRTS